MTSKIFSYRPKSYGSLKEAAAALIEAAGGVIAASDLCRVKKSALSDYANAFGKEKNHMPIDVVKQLEGASGCRAVTEHLAANHKCVLIQIPHFACHADWWRHVSEMTAEFGDVVKSAGTYLADGDLSEQESQFLLKELDQLLESAGALRQALESTEGHMAAGA